MKTTVWLERRAALTPDRIALIGGNEQLTFGELRGRAMTLARRLIACGVRKGDTVGMLCGNSVDTAVLVHAIPYTGAVLMPLNTRLTAQELVFQIEDASCRHLVADERFGQLADAVGERLPGLILIPVNRLAHEPAADAPLETEIDDEQTATIMYTSGTTGAPKGVIHTYGNHWASAIGSALNLGLHAEDRWLAAVPLFHISGLSILMRGVIYGISVVVHERFDPSAANEAIMEQGVTIVSVVSNMLARMMDDLGERRYPPHFRCMLLGGGPCPSPLLEACVRKGVPVFQTYGMTETASQIVTLPPEYMRTKLGSAGKPLFPCEIRIVDEEGADTAPCVPGEILVRGPNVTRGYWNRPEATAAAMQGGWFRTGDIGYVDEDGFLYVLDRRNDLIISGGENIYPAEIESVLTGHPDVADAGVTGIADECWGQVPVAFVVPRDGAKLREDELRAFCGEHLARYKIPTRFHVVDGLPRNAAGKLLRRELAAWTADRRE